MYIRKDFLTIRQLRDGSGRDDGGELDGAQASVAQAADEGEFGGRRDGGSDVLQAVAGGDFDDADG